MDGDDDNEATSSVAASTANGNGRAGAPARASQGAGGFPVLTMLEWPGQAEGESMDLEHFWNVIAMQFPEDHTAEWLDSMMEPLLKTVEISDAAQSLYDVPPLGKMHTPEGKSVGLSRSLSQLLGLLATTTAHKMQLMGEARPQSDCSVCPSVCP
jgi:hypothetical protein